MTVPYYQDDMVTLLCGDALDEAGLLPSGSVQTIITSPPYFGLRDYGMDRQIGDESSVHIYVEKIVQIFRELRRVLADDGTLWLNLGDSYTGSWGAQSRDAHSGLHTSVVDSGSYARNHGRTGSQRNGEPPAKNLLGVPWRVAFALQEDGWILRSEIIWAKPNPMPESVTDRPTKSHETLFLFSKSSRYFYDSAAIAEDAVKGAAGSRFDTGKTATHQLDRAQKGPRFGGTKYGDDDSLQSRTKSGNVYQATGKRNRRTVWTIPTQPFAGAHFAVYPPDLIRPCVLAGSRAGDVVLDPFSGSGTTGMVAVEAGRKYIGIDLNPEYLDLSLRTRFAQPVINFGKLP